MKEKIGDTIDESLYSRQLYVLGHDAMKKMAVSDVLISGLGGLGVEIAKNVILAGVKSVTLHDVVQASLEDLASQFYLNDDLIGKNRAEACHQKLSELNNYVATNVYTGELDEEILKKFSVAVISEKTLKEKIAISEMCRKLGISLIIADSRGLFGQVFCDFGDNFVIFDCDGIEPKTAAITNISKEEDAIVSCERWHNLNDGDFVTLSGIEGMAELNNCEPIKIKRMGNYTFKIGDTSKFGEYTSGGYVKEIKMPKTMSFKSFSESLKAPRFEFILCNIEKLEHPGQTHIAFRALDEYIERYGNFPRAWDEDDSEEFYNIAKQFAIDLNIDANEGFQRIFSKLCSGSVCPMNSVIGGIASQEVLKACSGKFTPINQFFCFDAIECLPENLEDKLDIFSNSRYTSQIKIFGNQIQKKLNNAKCFIVGSGAIGCELMKNFALMGIGSGDGKIFVTDMDLIEKSNLNRQFLFRPKDVQKSKSKVAAEAIRAMNNVNIQPFESKVCPDTENIFDEEFFESLNLIATALDNIDARLYIDRMSVLYKKPLIDAGIMGTLGNVQVIVPHLTESYSSSIDPPEKNVPMCTLKHFPTEIPHTIQWARDTFEGFFTNSVMHASKYLQDKNYLNTVINESKFQAKEILESIENSIKSKPKDFADCVRWAREQFEELFVNQIKQLLFNFPPDMLTPKGQPFWSGAKKMPEPVLFDLNCPAHVDFVLTAANLKAETYGIAQMRERERILGFLQQVTVPEFVPQSGVKISLTDDEQADNNEEISEDEARRLVEQIESLNKENLKIEALSFEKDDDTNLHMDFVVATSNLRATNYKIPTADRHTTKQIAGKIIPAIATSTAIVAGLVGLETYKIIQGCKEADRYSNGFFNLAENTYSFAEPRKAKISKYYDIPFTHWDQFEIEKEMTLKEFVEYFKNEHKLEISMLSHNHTLIYSFFMAESKLKARENMLISEVIESIMEFKFDSRIKSIFLEAYCNDLEGEELEVPLIKYHLRK